jgi:hypothetical protein
MLRPSFSKRQTSLTANETREHCVYMLRHFESSTADAFEADIRSLSNQDNVRPPHTREGYEFTGKTWPENEEGGRRHVETKNIIIIRSMMIHDLDRRPKVHALSTKNFSMLQSSSFFLLVAVSWFPGGCPSPPSPHTFRSVACFSIFRGLFVSLF